MGLLVGCLSCWIVQQQSCLGRLVLILSCNSRKILSICRVECVGAIPSYRLKVVVSHPNGKNIFILDDPDIEQFFKQSCSSLLGGQESGSQELFDYVVPDRMISKFLNQRFLFIVDSRPIGYQLDNSLHVVRGLSADPSIIAFFRVLIMLMNNSYIDWLYFSSFSS
ncbi:hypothetical protein PIB30_064812 [Stylosanthes scabra]|uniref:Uncharacterized protein n=1 Tax=Stylosanthes scabra TaxID=79078 RepID=A0ABU6TMJ6_9FABA|nr:hypothetical protein [Stylosanthes scabra]